MNDVLSAAMAFLGTLALHSTILLGGAALLDCSGAIRREATRELLWRVALFGAFVTAALQMCVGITPLGGSLATVVADVASAAVGGMLAPGPEVSAASAVVPVGVDLARLATLVWLAGVLLGLLHLAGTAWRLRARLGLRPVSADIEGRVQALARTLGLLRVTVSWSDRAATPLMLGLWRHELCISERAHAELTASELDAVLVHELAHARGRDPAWALASSLALRVVFWQPLAWLARRRLAALAELRCDDIARRSAPAAALALSRALVCAAEWLRDRRAPAIVCGHAMASVRSGLARRVHRLLAEPGLTPTGPTRAARSLAVGALLSMSVILPTAVPAVLPSAPPAPAAMLPPPLRALGADLATLRAEFDEVHSLVRALDLGEDPTVASLVGQIEARLVRLEWRLASLAVRHAPPTLPGPSGPTFPDLGATSR